MRRKLVTLLAALVLSACATAAQAGGDNRVTVVVSNEYTSMITASVLWSGAPRLRLGEISPHQKRTFSTPRRAGPIALGVEVFSTPPPATGAGPSAPG